MNSSAGFQYVDSIRLELVEEREIKKGLDKTSKPSIPSAAVLYC